ncbi:MAG: type VI-C CRISPR-associated RNA-guided ribonuclease Cas13c [Fusobacteriaceae bacterium]
MNKKIKNKSSIARIIISNFDSEKIKEIKILHEKKSFLDVFEIKEAEYCSTKNKIKFIDVVSIGEDKLNIKITEEGNIEASLEREKNIIRKYLISGEYFDKKSSKRYHRDINSNRLKNKGSLDDKTVKIKLEILENLNWKGEEKKDRRRNETITERKLLSGQTQEYYSIIANNSLNGININIDNKNTISYKMIDSQMIYSIKRFLNYRSSMLMYFSFINNFFIKNDEIQNIIGEDNFGIEEIGKIFKNNTSDNGNCELVLNILAEEIQKIMIKAFEYLNNQIKNNNDKRKRMMEENKKGDIPEFIEEIPQLSVEELKEDLKKIVIYFADFRHKLVHYNYQYFQELFSGKGEIQKDICEQLSLNIFKLLSTVKNLKNENKTNYLDKFSEITILGKIKQAVKVYNLYNTLCEKSNGFNKFINSFFSVNGEEDKEFKVLINEHMEKRIEYLKNRKLKLEKEIIEEKNLKSKNKLKELIKKYINELSQKEKAIIDFSEAYLEDIHYSEKYKIQYNKHKNKVAEVEKEITKKNDDRNKKRIESLNKEILNFKIQMEKLTKLNSTIRLEYKMQIAFGFLAEEYEFDISKFKNDFDPNSSNIMSYLNKKEIYLNKFTDDKCKLNLGNIEKEIKISPNVSTLFVNSEDNNLSKFYSLMYLFIPIEIRGDFLGNVKKHYYDIKNLTNNNQNDCFFHNLRLFEKNIKKLEIIKYSISEDQIIANELENIYKYLGIKQKIFGEEFLFGKTVILNIIKYYENIFKFMNDFETNLLIEMVYKKNIKEKYLKTKKNKEFSKLLYEYFKFSKDKEVSKNYEDNISNGQIKLDKIINVRNKISHLDFNKLFCLEKIKDEENYKNNWIGLNNITGFLDSFFDEIDTLYEGVNTQCEKSEKRIKNILEYDYINDFKMRNKDFIFNLKKDLIASSQGEEKKKNQKEILQKHSSLKDIGSDAIFKNILCLGDTISKLEIKFNKKIFANNKDIMNFKVFPTKEKISKIGELSHIFKSPQINDKIIATIKRELNLLLGIYKNKEIERIKKKLINIFE